MIATSSGLAHSTHPFLGSYSATKVGVEYMCKSIAQSLKFEGKTNIICVPLAPGVVVSEMMRDKSRGVASSKWVQTAAPFILSLNAMDNGASMVVPGMYDKKYQSTWIIPAGLPLNDFTSPRATSLSTTKHNHLNKDVSLPK